MTDQPPKADPAAFRPPRFSPRRFPPPEFPPRRAAVFAKTPPAIFPVLLGLLGLVLALRAGLSHLGLPLAAADLAAGLAVPLWAFGVLAYAVKLARRPAVILDDMKVMPARAGLAAATAGGMAAAAVVAPYAPQAATGLLAAALALHAAYLALFLKVLAGLPPEGRVPNPGWHLIFVGFIIGGLAAGLLGRTGLAGFLLWAMVPVAAVLWGAGALQFLKGSPPAPLRPLLAIHLAPASLFASVATLLQAETAAMLSGGLALALFLALASGGRWLLAAGFGPLWGALTFPLAAFAGAMIRLGGTWAGFGLGILGVALVVVPLIAWHVLKLWPGGRLAARTNAAEA